MVANVLDRIRDELPSLPRKLAMAARFAVDNPTILAFSSMRAAAHECGVASPTMLRLARHMGSDGYEEFRKEFQSVIVSNSFDTRASELRRKATELPHHELVPSLREAAAENINAALTQNDPDTITQMAQVIRRARKTHLVGAGSMHWLAAMMENTGSVALDGLTATRPGTATVIETFSTLSDQDAVLVIAVAPYARTAIEAIEYARETGAKTLVITDRRSSPLNDFADLSLIAPTESPHYYPSIVGVVVLIETLLATAVAEGKGPQIDQINRVVELRKRSGAYVE